MDDFDRSFEYFEKHSSSLSPFDSVKRQEEANDLSFASDAFDFSATLFREPEEIDHEVFHDEKNDRNVFRGQGGQKAEIRIHEQVSALYDDFSQDGAIAVTGTIYVQTPLQSLHLNLKNTRYIQRFEERENLSQLLPQPQGRTTRGLKVQIPEKGMATLTEIPVANFYCVAKARPVPLLIKRKINALKGFVRVGFKVRSNPHNKAPLQSVYIVMAIPPDVEGEKCKMSVKGGSWNEMKRTMTWLIKELAPGKAIEIQAQFPAISNTLHSVPKFPILIKATYSGLYSELSVDSADRSCDVNVRTSTCLLHRKV